jgi:hypothetical protein
MVREELVNVEEKEVDVKLRKVGTHASSHLEQALEDSLHELGCKRTISEGSLGGSRALALLGPLGYLRLIEEANELRQHPICLSFLEHVDEEGVDGYLHQLARLVRLRPCRASIPFPPSTLRGDAWMEEGREEVEDEGFEAARAERLRHGGHVCNELRQGV